MVPEPWLRGTLGEVEPVRRAVIHALELAREDVERWAAELGDAEMFARPLGLPAVAFQLRHMVRSLDRLLTYAEGKQLSEEQLRALEAETGPGDAVGVLEEFRAGLEMAKERVAAIEPQTFEKFRGVGRRRLPSTVAGLLIHCAEHTQRHVGQMVTMVKVLAGRGS